MVPSPRCIRFSKIKSALVAVVELLVVAVLVVVLVFAEYDECLTWPQAMLNRAGGVPSLATKNVLLLIT